MTPDFIDRAFGGVGGHDSATPLAMPFRIADALQRVTG